MPHPELNDITSLPNTPEEQRRTGSMRPLLEQALGRQIGQIQSATPTVITGEQLRKLSEIRLRLELAAPDIIFARVGADQKMRIVSALKKKKHGVAADTPRINNKTMR